MNTAVQPSLAQRIAALAEEADADVGRLRREYADFDKFVAQRFDRLSEEQQRVVLAAVRADEGTELTSLLERWSRAANVSLRVRVEVLESLEALGCPVDADALGALRQAAEVVRQLDVDELPELGDDEMLAAPLDTAVRALPLPLAVDVARQAALDDLARGLAILRTVRPRVEAAELPVLVDGLAAIPLTGSAVLLLDILSDSPPKALQKAVKKALHQVAGRRLQREPGPASCRDWRRRESLGALSGELYRRLWGPPDPDGSCSVGWWLSDRLLDSQLRRGHSIRQGAPNEPARVARNARIGARAGAAY